MNKRNVSLLSLATITCAVALIIGSSFAIFTDSKKVNNHLAAGSLEVSLKRTSYSANVIDETGSLKETHDETVIDLTKDPSSLFNINVVPGAWAKATIEISNLNSVAFDYGVRLLWDEKPSLLPFASQICIIISNSLNDYIYKEFSLDKCNLSENTYTFSSPLLIGEKNSFDIKASFLDDEDNNSAQGKILDFDLQVFAIQHLDKGE